MSSKRTIKTHPQGAIVTVDEIKALGANTRLYCVHAFINDVNSQAYIDNDNEPSYLVGLVQQHSSNSTLVRESYWFKSGKNQIKPRDFVTSYDGKYMMLGEFNSLLDRNIPTNNYNSHFIFKNLADAKQYVNDVVSGIYSNDELSTPNGRAWNDGYPSDDYLWGDE